MVLFSTVLFLMMVDMPFSFAVSSNDDSWKIYKLSGNFITPDNTGTLPQIFNIPYRLQGGNLEMIQVDQEAMSFLMIIKNNTGDEIQIVIPRNLLDVQSSVGIDGQFFVLVDGIKTNYIESENQCFRSLSIPIHVDSKTIEIVSDNTDLNILKNSQIQPLYIETDKDHYSSGDTVIVEGCVSLTLDEGDITVNVLDQNEKIYQNLLILPNKDGTFFSSFIIDNKLATDEQYTVKAEYGEYVATKTLTVPEFHLVILVLFVAVISTTLFSRKLSWTKHM